jgi:hypothetical protein
VTCRMDHPCDTTREHECIGETFNAKQDTLVLQIRAYKLEHLAKYLMFGLQYPPHILLQAIIVDLRIWKSCAFQESVTTNPQAFNFPL